MANLDSEYKFFLAPVGTLCGSGDLAQGSEVLHGTPVCGVERGGREACVWEFGVLCVSRACGDERRCVSPVEAPGLPG